MSVRSCPSVRTEQLVSHWMDFSAIWYLNIFRKSRKFRFHSDRTRLKDAYITTTIHFWSYLAQFFLKWEIFQTKVIDEIKTHISCSVTFSFFLYLIYIYIFLNCTVYEIMWKNTVEWVKPQTIIWRMRIACWITKATDTHSQYAILTAFTLQEWLNEPALMLRYK
jgi:hypothetical protein